MLTKDEAQQIKFEVEKVIAIHPTIDKWGETQTRKGKPIYPAVALLDQKLR